MALSIPSSKSCFASNQGGLKTMTSALTSQFSNKSLFFRVILSSNPNLWISLETPIIAFLFVSDA